MPKMQKELSCFNYVYFGLFFLGLVSVHFFHLFIIQSSFSNFPFMVTALLQCLIEVTLLMCIAEGIRRTLPAFFNGLFILGTACLFLAHLLDFPLVRVMDMSVWYALDFISQESVNNFLEILSASNVSTLSWMIGFFVGLAIIVIALGCYVLTQRCSKAYPLSFSFTFCSLLFLFSSIALFVWDNSGNCYSQSSLVAMQHCKALPWKTTLQPNTLICLPLRSTLKEKQVKLSQEKQIAIKTTKTPNVFLFIAESLREDYMTASIAPSMAAFKKEGISFDLALSNANATQMSWFSLFHSQFPFYWTNTEEKEGSLPLKLLKSLGYKIHVYTSSSLCYYQMDERIFGTDHHLADDFFYFPHDHEIPAYRCDAEAMQRMQDDVEKADSQGGHLFIVFLEATHFDYSWPEKSTLFTPITDEINYLKVACSTEEVEEIKNRYRNAVHYVDSLFGAFQAELKAKNKWKDAVVVFTGDHGEEFYEEGHLFHASNLNRIQTHVPLYYKLGDKNSKKHTALTSHMDIFPTLLEYIVGDERYAHLFQGESVFKEKKWPFAVTARYNASREPYEFSIHNGKQTLLAQFTNKEEIFEAEEIEVLSLKDQANQALPFTEMHIQESFGAAFERLFAP